MPSNFYHVSLVYGLTGQTVEYYPPAAEVIWDGAPTAGATYRVYAGTASNDDTAEIGPSSATLDAVSTTVDAASGYSQTNRRKVNLTATSSIAVGRRYLLANAYGQREVVTVAYIASADYVEVEEPLAFDYATADTFKGLRHVFTIDSVFIADSSSINISGLGAGLAADADTATSAPPWRVEWRYTTGSTDRRSWTTFDVSRAPAKSLVSFDELRELFPDLVHQEWIDTRGQDYAGQLRAAERDLRIDIRAAGYDPDQIQDPQIHQRLLLQKWAAVILNGLAFARPEVNDLLAKTEADFARMFDKVINSTLRAWVSTSSTGAVSAAPARQLWLRSR